MKDTSSKLQNKQKNFKNIKDTIKDDKNILSKIEWFYGAISIIYLYFLQFNQILN